jgi:PIN domain nuclease of toxin-antitoxin system
LLDTHVWLWWQADDRRLGSAARNAISAAAEVRFSAASAWEIAIKVSIGQLRLPRGADIDAELRRDGFRSLGVDITHTAALMGLPRLHRDPFDRMLVAQAMVEGLTLATADDELARYGVPILRAWE